MIKSIISIATLIALPATTTYAALVEEHLGSSDTNLVNIYGNVYTNIGSQTPTIRKHDKPYIERRYSGNSQNDPLYWNVGQFTGYGVQSQYLYSVQIGHQMPTGSQYQGNAVQVEGQNVGIYMDSRTFANPSIPTSVGGPQTVWTHYWSYPPTPWKFQGDHLTVESDIKMPTFATQQNGVVQLSYVLYFDTETTSGAPQTFAMVVNMAHSKMLTPEYSGHDSYVSFVSSPMSNSSTFIDIDSTSATHSTSSWSNYRKYKFHLTWNNMLTIIQKINNEHNGNLSQDRLDYELVNFTIMPEMAITGNYSGDAQVGLTFKNVKVRTCNNKSCN